SGASRLQAISAPSPPGISIVIDGSKNGRLFFPPLPYYFYEWNCAASPLILLICAAEMRMANYSHLDDATYWRTRAKEMRALAQQAGAFDRNDILGMAEDYERLAERADELARFARKYCAKNKTVHYQGRTPDEVIE